MLKGIQKDVTGLAAKILLEEGADEHTTEVVKIIFLQDTALSVQKQESAWKSLQGQVSAPGWPMGRSADDC